MKTVLGSKIAKSLVRLSVFLITAALIAGMASCAPVKYHLIMGTNPVGGGNATDLTNASPYSAGTVVSIKAVATAGYWFANWTAPAGTFANADAAQTNFTMPAQNAAVTANFASFAGGSGTEGEPYQIADWYQLDGVRNYLDSYFVLVNDLDSSTAGYTELASPTANDGKGWQPIGTYGHIDDNPFTGTFDGQEYEIRDLFIHRPDEESVGLFGWVMPGVIKDIGMVNVTVTGNLQVGGLVGNNFGTVSSSYSSGNVSGIASTVGGLVGDNGDVGTVSNCHSACNVTSDNNVGGLVGENYGTVSKCYSSGNVTSYYSVGGLMGANYGTVSNSYSTGSATGTSEIGGLVGANGYDGTVSKCYSTSISTGDNNVGGLVGENLNGIVSNSFWDIETSGQATSDGGTGKNTTEMQRIATFSDAGWNITVVALNETNPAYIWNIVNNVTYPFLSWQP